MRRAVLEVEDNGVGIPREALARVMKPFEQMGAPLENGFKGSGLGLAIARSIVELHGGSLRIRSNPGHGTIVRVQLPIEPIAPMLPMPELARAAAAHDPAWAEGPEPLGATAGQRVLDADAAAELEHGILGGYDLGRDYPQLKNYMLLAVTEMNSKEDIDALVEVLSEVSHD